LREDRPIDHATARAIAAQLHGGQGSPLYALASSGAIVEGLSAELASWREDNETGVEVEPWLDALDEYIQHRDDPNPVGGWSKLWPSQPRTQEAENHDEPEPGTGAREIGRSAINARVELDAEDDEQARRDLFERISAAGVTRLGQVATVIGGTVEVANEDQGETDGFHWADAAQWSPADVALIDYDDRHYSPEELDELFSETPDEQVGSVEELGWYGLVKHEGRPGGLILATDEQGFRHVRDAHTNEALSAQWAAIQHEYESFYEQRDAYELATEETDDSPSGLNPRIWVGSLADYNNGQLHGVWLDATLDPDELHHAIQFMLRNGYTPGAEEWGIFDYDEFGGYEVHEYANLKTVSRIAQCVAEHGPAYAAWVELVGDESEELLTDEAFRDHFEGEYALEDYVEYILDETGFTAELDRALQGLPEDLRHYVQVDIEGIAEEWGQGLHVVETDGGKVWVFDARG
jgi:antirestriction protein